MGIQALGVQLPELPFSDFPNLKKALRGGYVIEIIRKRTRRETLDAHVFVLNPRVYNVSEPFQNTLTPTEHNTVLEEVNGITVREITLEGTFGLNEREPRKFDLQNQNKRAGGNEQFQTLRQLFRNYSDWKKDPDQAPYIRMIFHSLRDNDHWTVVPKSFETPRSADTTRMHYEYKISLLATGIGASIEEIITDKLGLSDVFRIVDQALAEATGFVSDINAALAQVRRKIANIDAIMIGVAGLLTQVRVSLENTRDLSITYPHRLAVSTAANVDTAARKYSDLTKNTSVTAEERAAERALRQLGTSLSMMLIHPDVFAEASSSAQQRIETMFYGERNLTAEDLANGTGGASAGSAARAQFGTESDAGVRLGSYTGFRQVRVTAAMTLRSIAETYGVSTELLTIVNALKPPYISRAGGLGVLRPGDLILVPVFAESQQAIGSNPASSYRDVDRTLYGYDFALDAEQLKQNRLDFAIDKAHGATDASYVGGIGSIKTGLELIVRTEQGTTQFIPTLGLSLPVGSKGNIRSVLLAASNMQDAILGDDRIELIESSTVIFDGDVLTQEVQPRIRGRQDGGLTVVSPIGKATTGA